MATITFNGNSNANSALLNIPTEIDSVGITGSTFFEIGDPRFTVLRLEGTGFIYSAPRVPSAGMITGFSLKQGGVTTVTVTGLPPLLSLTQAEALRLEGTPGSLLRYLLSGNDVASAGTGDQTILSEGGDDTLNGGAGADYVVAGEGDDLVISSLGQGPAGGAVERLFGGEGIDSLIIDRSDQALAFVFDIMVNDVTAMLDGTRLSGFEQMKFHAGSGSDQLAGGNLDDIVSAGAGNDSISGRGGNDTLSGGDGADNVDGGAGDDAIIGEEGLDKLDGGSGSDTLHGGGQADNLFGGSGRDILNGGSGADNIDGGSDDDTMSGDLGADVLEGGPGNDILDGGAEADYLSGSDGDDTLNGGSSADNIEGGNGNDILDGGVGPDTLLGNLGNDLYYIDDSNDMLFDAFGEGYDVVLTLTSYFLTAAAEIELLRASDPKGKVAIDLRGNGFANIIEGNAGANIINGLRGKDTLKGGRGQDTFVFNTKLSKKNIDKILDFKVKDDAFQLSRSIFKKLTAEDEGNHKILAEGTFCIAAKAQDADDRIIYNKRSGKLSYDEDGTGDIKPITFARLSKGLKLTEADFWV
ncbi:calcium-binding protein [Microvirga sp. CF3016]|uniref:calcium-binding protein n=1 Tax=Microvirga sp. CF3016 TaxID=3110181 RepID=UPI002E76FB4B|nr:calcium-binding protein [Microvirga sp. CF3016]MEE1611401.1 calcium-binding protein [Microvirga sp. CF3016]